MRELLEPRSNLKNRSNRKSIQPHVCEEIFFLIWNSGMDLKWENDEEDLKMKQKKYKKHRWYGKIKKKKKK